MLGFAKHTSGVFFLASCTLLVYSYDMSKRLRQLMAEHVAKKGHAGLAELSAAADRGVRMIERYIVGQVNPSSHVAYKLALQCGCSYDEALTLSSGSQEKAKAG